MIRNSIARAVSSLVTRPVNGAKLSFEIVMKKLFANGEQGFWYDPNDMGTMFQDAAGTVPVTAVGQAVGLIKDKSGRNNHAYQTTSASRPILRQNAATGAYYLEFDGTDDFLQTNNINFTATDKMSLFTGVRKLSDAATGALVGLGLNGATVDGSFELFAPASNGATKYQYLSRGTEASFAQALSTELNAPRSSVITGMSDIANDVCVLRVDGKVAHAPTSNQGSGRYVNSSLYIGRRGGTTLPFNGHIYSLIGIGRLTTDAETTAIEKELAKRTGVTLNV